MVFPLGFNLLKQLVISLYRITSFEACYSVEEIAMNSAHLWAFFIISVISYAQALEDLGGMSYIYI